MEEESVEHQSAGGEVVSVSVGLRNEVEGGFEENELSEVHEEDHDEDLVGGLHEHLAPHLGKHDLVLATDAVRLGGPGGVVLVGLGADGDGAEDVHDEVDPEHLDDVEGRPAQREARQEGDEAEDDVDGELELQELADVVEDGAAPLDAAVDGHEVVVEDDQVRVVLGHVAARTHAQAHVRLPQRLGIGDAVARHAHQATSLLDAGDKEELVLRGAPSDDSELLLELVESLLLSELNLDLAAHFVSDLSVRTEGLSELLSSNGVSVEVSLLVRDDS
mmetsp:Transcript_14890/g.25364  ORF Transcript_14890/g.25364 Transcript_14890/m.25364 type:complete len:276 (-) Transcript_14890:2131-2958(-)